MNKKTEGKGSEEASTPKDGKREGIEGENQRWDREVLITKEYKTMGGFIRGCRAVLKKVFDDPYGDDLTMQDSLDGPTVEDRIRAGEFVEYNHGSGLEYKAGFEFEFPDRIYVFFQDREVSD